MEFRPPNAVNKDGTVIYRSGMNPKIHRKKVWEADPLICPTCQREMRIVSLIDQDPFPDYDTEPVLFYAND